MKFWLKGILITSLFMLSFSNFILAQPGDPGGNPDVPLGGIEYLIGLGALYGFRQFIKKARSK